MGIPYTLVEKSVLRKPASAASIGDVLVDTQAWMDSLQQGSSVTNFFYYAEVIDAETKQRYFVYSLEATQYFGLSNSIVEVDGIQNTSVETGAGLPTQTGMSGKVLSTDGTNPLWIDLPSNEIELKTINGTSILGSGDIVISGSGTTENITQNVYGSQQVGNFNISTTQNVVVGSILPFDFTGSIVDSGTSNKMKLTAGKSYQFTYSMRNESADGQIEAASVVLYNDTEGKDVDSPFLYNQSITNYSGPTTAFTFVYKPTIDSTCFLKWTGEGSNPAEIREIYLQVVETSFATPMNGIMNYGQWSADPAVTSVNTGAIIPIFGVKQQGSLTSKDNSTFTCKAGVTYKVEVAVAGILSNSSSLHYAFVDLNGNIVSNVGYTALPTSGANVAYNSPIFCYVKFDVDTDIKLKNTGSNNITTLYYTMSYCNITEISTAEVSLGNYFINGKQFDSNNNIDLEGYSTLSNYSTDEQLTERRWIDGKPIYRKIVVLGNLTSLANDTNTAKVVTFNEGLNIETTVMANVLSGSFDEYNEWFSSNTSQVRFGATAKSFIANVSTSNASALSNIRVITEYTKTTDTANSPVRLIGPSVTDYEMAPYSTTEQLTEKRWVDGKPIYTKSFTGTLAANAVDISIAPGISNVDMIKISDYYVKRTDGIVFSTSNNYYGSNAAEMNVNINNGNINLNIGDGAAVYSNAPYTITVEYTKTTDTASSPVRTLKVTDNLPAVTSADAGKMLMVNANGQYEWHDDVYSLDETITNKVWMGSRVYRKVFYYKFPASGVNDVTINTGLTLANKYRVTDFVCFGVDRVNTQATSYHYSDSNELRVYMNNIGQIAIYVSDGDTIWAPNSEWYITVEYIKP